jgi:hypothetical protein
MDPTDLKERFRAKSEKLRNRPIPSARERKGMLLFVLSSLPTLKEYSTGNDTLLEAPALPTSAPPKDPKTEMQDFLDDLLG